MLFNSYIFIFYFLPITFLGYFILNSKNKTTASKIFLVIASLFFYSWWNIIYLPIILVSIIFNYFIGKLLANNTYQINKKTIAKKHLLILGIAANVALLGYFKYTDFFIENLNFVLTSDIDLFNLALPLAISFFTFQQIAYLVDSYKSDTKEYGFLNYSLFVTFFPQLIAGPIVHHKEMMSQFSQSKNKNINYTNIAIGLFIFSIGLFKKVVIADTFAIWATNGFDTLSVISLYEAWVTSLSYTFQLYFDFSGYCDMAIGLGLFFNIKLPINFNSPYKSTNIQDFWQRWHITLGSFLRDYIYIPLGGSRNGNIKTYANVMATFILAGLWHGAGWTFVFWGALHGLALVVFRIWGIFQKKYKFTLWRWLAWFITFNFINIAWVFFRAKEWNDAIKILSAMFNIENIFSTQLLTDLYSNLIKQLSFILPDFITSKHQFFVSEHSFEFKTFCWIFICLFIVIKCKNSYEIISYGQKSLTNQPKILNKTNSIIFALLFMFSILYMSISTYSEFIYFNF